MITNIKSYIINLKKYKNKYDLCLERLNKLKLQLYRFDALSIKNENESNIKKITYPSVQYTIKNGRTGHNNIGSTGAIGCYLSHIALWKKLVESNDNMYIIFEDDVDINNNIKNINEKINKYLINITKFFTNLISNFSKTMLLI